MATSEPNTTPKTQPPSQPPPYETSQQQVVYPPTQHHVTNTTIIAQPTAVPIMTRMFFGSMPMGMICPHCQAQIVTSTSHEPGILTWLTCGGIALVGCFFGCCFIPFCIDDLKDCRHTCPNCRNFLGVYRRI